VTTLLQSCDKDFSPNLNINPDPVTGQNNGPSSIYIKTLDTIYVLREQVQVNTNRALQQLYSFTLSGVSGDGTVSLSLEMHTDHLVPPETILSNTALLSFDNGGQSPDTWNISFSGPQQTLITDASGSMVSGKFSGVMSKTNNPQIKMSIQAIFYNVGINW
jgi:hypothetical protein